MVNHKKLIQSNRTIEVDMSSQAIDQRLRDLSQLYELGMSLRGVRPVIDKNDFSRDQPPSSQPNDNQN